MRYSSKDYRKFSFGLRIEGSGNNRVTAWLWWDGRFRYGHFRSPVNPSAHSWRYAIRHLGFARAALARGFVRA